MLRYTGFDSGDIGVPANRYLFSTAGRYAKSIIHSFLQSGLPGRFHGLVVRLFMFFFLKQ